MPPTPKYNPEYHDDWAWSLASKGAIDDEIAEAFGISVRTLHRWKQEYPSFLQALTVGKEAADAKIEKSLYKRALGYDVKEKETLVETDKGILFWAISLTWGLPMTLIGTICAIALIVTGHKPQRFHYFIYFEVGSGWGGFEAGGFFFVNRHPSLHIRQHESGHGLQNIMLGVLMPFLVSIPSMIRYWYRELIIRSGKKKYSDLPDYDAIWFEGWATRLGEKHFK